jgi:hypothetical protein
LFQETFGANLFSRSVDPFTATSGTVHTTPLHNSGFWRVNLIARRLWFRRKHLFFPANRLFWDISQRPPAFENRNPFMQNPLRKARMAAS